MVSVCVVLFFITRVDSTWTIKLALFYQSSEALDAMVPRHKLVTRSCFN
jgi:hypothetical protein